MTWLLLIHQVPAKPDYLRVKVARRLQRVGALPVKHAVHVLPATEGAREDFSWIAREIVEGQGEATIVEASLVEGLDDDTLVERFRAARDEDAAPLVQELEALHGALDRGTDVSADLRRLRRRLDEVHAIDFFGSPAVLAARGWVERIDRRLSPSPDGAERRDWTGTTWVTRAGIKVDRMASAWLIRRFVDPDARFKFVPGKSYEPEPGEQRFDMFEAEFGHEGEQCTFEVLVRRMGLDDPALTVLGELVHDVDLKDGRFGRPETAGFAMTVEAIARRHPEDEDRLARACAWLDDLHALFGREHR